MENEMIIQLVIIGVIAYCLGNISFSIILSRLAGIDIKKEGSGNAGATNTFRVLGAKAGIITLVMDVLKGIIAVNIGLHMGLGIGGMVAFACVIIGHCFPAINKFKGGKGVATTLGAAFALNWPSAFAALVIAGLMLLITKKMSIGSMTAAIAYPFLMLFYDEHYFQFTIFIAVYLVFMHRGNIKRLIRHEEPNFTIGTKVLDKLGITTEVITAAGENGDVEVSSPALSDVAEAVETVEIESAETAADKAEENEETESTEATEPEEAETAVPETEAEAETEVAEASDEEEEGFSTGEKPEAVAAAEASGIEDVDYYEGIKIPKWSKEEKLNIGIIGNGSMGSAVANLIAHNGHQVMVYSRDREAVDYIKESRVNDKYLPFCVLSEKIRYTHNLATVVRNRDIIIMAVPSQEYAGVLKACAKNINENAIILNVAKGIDSNSGKFISEITADVLPDNSFAVLAGAARAESIVRNQEAEEIVATADESAAETIRKALENDVFKITVSDKIRDVEIAGAAKNVLALGSGFVDKLLQGSSTALGYTDSAYKEIKTLLKACGCDESVADGPAGIEDLENTCATPLSRNVRFGIMLALGADPDEAAEKFDSVVEGYKIAEAFASFAEKNGAETPIINAVAGLIEGELSVEAASEKIQKAVEG